MVQFGPFSPNELKAFSFDMKPLSGVYSRLGRRCYLSTAKDTNSAIKKFLQIKGPDSKSFLQGLCTNDTSKLNGHGDFIYAAFLNTKGRIIADSIIHDVSTSTSPSVLLEIPSSVFPELSKHLSMYKLRSKIQMTEIKDSKSLLPQSSISIVEDDSRESKYKYIRYRYLRGLAEGDEMSNRIPLEMNLDLLNYISFTKGCYIGQELIARTHFKGQIRKRVVPFKTHTRSKEMFSFNKYDLDTIKAIENEEASITTSDAQLNMSIPVGSKVHVTRGTDPSEVEVSPVGEVIAYEPRLGLGLALLRLEDLFSSSGSTASSSVHTFLVDRSIQDVQASSRTSEGMKGETSSDALHSTSPVASVASIDSPNWISMTPFRPHWWPDIDPLTGKTR